MKNVSTLFLDVKAGGTHGYHSTTNYYATMPKHRTILVLCSHGTRVNPAQTR